MIFVVATNETLYLACSAGVGPAVESVLREQ